MVHVGDGFGHLGHALALLMAGGANLAHDVGDFVDGAHDFGHGGAGLINQGGALFNPLHAVGNQLFHIFGGLGAALGQHPHFTGDHGKATTLLASACCFYGGVQGQQIGLESDGVDHANDVGNALRALLYALHGVNHALHGLTAIGGDACGLHGQLVGLLGVVHVLADGGVELLHRGGSLLQRAGLLLGAGAQVAAAQSNLGAGGGHAFGVLAHAVDHAREAAAHGGQRTQDARHFAQAALVNGLRQIALGHAVRSRNGLMYRGHDEAVHVPEQGHNRQQHQRRHPAQGQEPVVLLCCGSGDGAGGAGVEHAEKLIDGFHDARLDGVVLGAVQQVAGLVFVGFAVHGVAAIAIVIQALDHVHGLGLQFDEVVGFFFRGVQQRKFTLGKASLLHQVIERNAWAHAFAGGHVGSAKVPVDFFVLIGARLAAIAYVQ